MQNDKARDWSNGYHSSSYLLLSLKIDTSFPVPGLAPPGSGSGSMPDGTIAARLISQVSGTIRPL